MITLAPTTTEAGRTWHLFAVDFDTPDGRFSTYIYAISHEHASAMLEDLRETGSIRGQIV